MIYILYINIMYIYFIFICNQFPIAEIDMANTRPRNVLLFYAINLCMHIINTYYKYVCTYYKCISIFNCKLYKYLSIIYI